MLLAAPLNATQVVAGGSNVDSGPWGQAGVPYGAPFIANQVICGLDFEFNPEPYITNHEPST
jgi:hypothetical protein